MVFGTLFDTNSVYELFANILTKQDLIICGIAIWGGINAGIFLNNANLMHEIYLCGIIIWGIAIWGGILGSIILSNMTAICEINEYIDIIFLCGILVWGTHIFSMTSDGSIKTFSYKTYMKLVVGPTMCVMYGTMYYLCNSHITIILQMIIFFIHF